MGSLVTKYIFYRYDVELYVKVAVALLIGVIVFSQIYNYLWYRSSNIKAARRRNARNEQ